MKILLATTGSENFSGAAKCLLELANGLRSKCNQVIVLLLDHGEIENLLKQENIDYYVIKQYQAWYIHLDNKYPNRYPRIKRIANRRTVNAEKTTN